MADRPVPRRIATLSVHTSPLEQPGTGDAGGMNVYIVEVSKRLARLGVEVEIFTRATRSELEPVVEMAPGVYVRHINAGPYEGLSKEELPSQLCAFTTGVLRAEAAHPPGWYDLIHSHYWMSGQVGWLARERWGVPHVHTAHTLAKVKNRLLAAGDRPEPKARVIGEEQVIAESDRLVANTVFEAADLVAEYDADPNRTVVIEPGVDLGRFRPGAADRARLGLPLTGHIVAFVGRIQPLKAPDVLISAVARLKETSDCPVTVVICGGPSGSGLDRPQALIELAASLGVAGSVLFLPPQTGDDLAALYRAADLVAVPSYNESFGLVALEAQACGTPVIAAAVGGLVTAVRDGVSGVLIDGHDPADWARVMERLLRAPALRHELSAGAVAHASAFSWDRTAKSLLRVYGDAMTEHRDLIAARVEGGDLRMVTDLIERVCTERELEWEATAPGHYVVTLPGTHKLKTVVNLIVGEHALRVEAFVMRHPDENHEQLWAWMLRRNARMYGVSFSIDAVGDVYLTGRMALTGLDEDELDRLLGSVLTYADESFDTMLEIGFGSSIRREWEWRVKRGESLANLQAFKHLVEDGPVS